jgi:hypothetical protein
MEMLDRIRKNEYIKQEHNKLDAQLEKIMSDYGMKFMLKKGQPQYSAMFQRLEGHLVKLLKSFREGYAMITDVTPDWLKEKRARDERRGMFNKAIEVLEKQAQVAKEEEQGEVVPRCRKKAWYILDPNFLDFRFKGNKLIKDQFEGIMFPAGTSLAEQFPDDWKAFPREKLEQRVSRTVVQKLRLMQERMKLLKQRQESEKERTN